LEQGPMGRVRIRTEGAPANVYLNGRLVGVTPLDLQRVFAGSYRMHLRRGRDSSRLHAIEIRAGNNEHTVDISFDVAIRDEEPPSLVYPAAAVGAEQVPVHVVRMAEATGAGSVLVFSVEDANVTLMLVDADGKARTVTASAADAANAAAGLRDGKIGT